MSKTWLSENHARDAFNIPYYIMGRKNRVEGGECVAFYLSTKYTLEHINRTVKCKDSSIKQLWIKINFVVKVVTFTVFY